MDQLVSDQNISVTIDAIMFLIRSNLMELENKGRLMVNQINVLRFELNYARESILRDDGSLQEHLRSWVYLMARHLQTIDNGSMPTQLLEETISSLLRIIDDCPIIGNIYKCLEQLENQEGLTVNVENHLQILKLGLRNFKIHFKWRIFSSPLLIKVRSWLKDVEECLLQSTGKGSVTADLLEETLSSFWNGMILKKIELTSDCLYRLWSDKFHHNFAYTNAPINELVSEWIAPLQDNLKHLICRNELSFVVLPKEQIEALVEKLGFLRNFLEILGMDLIEVIKNGVPVSCLLHKTSEDLLRYIKRLILNATYVSFLSWADRKHQQVAEMFLLVLLAKIDHIEPEIRMIYVQCLKISKMANPGALEIDLQVLVIVESLLENLQKLLKNRDTAGSFMHLDVHQIEFLHQELSLLKYFFMDPHVNQCSETKGQSFNSLLIQFEAISRELGASLTLSVCDGQRKDHLAIEMKTLHPNLLKVVNLLKIEIKQMYLRVPKPSRSNFPRTPKLGFVNFFIQNLEVLLRNRADSIAYVRYEIETLQSELALLSLFIRDTTKNLKEAEENIARHIVDVAYEAEQVIDSISASYFPRWYYMLWLFDIIEEIKTLRKDCTKVYSKKTCDISVLNVENASSTSDPNRARNLATEQEMVGFQDEAKMIIDQLTGGTKELNIVSIVGMPGIGKTTLAKKVYEHPSITKYFHVCSWYCISQVYDRQDLLHHILDDVFGEVQKMNDEDMANMLRKGLKGRRYLIILDDIWSIEPWNDICNSFPNDCNGSRILFTSRIQEVALQANPRSSPHDLRLLSDEESWELLHNKVFKQRSYPLEMHTIGKKIVKGFHFQWFL